VGLNDYWKKRRFDKTPEPSGRRARRAAPAAKRKKALSFVIQKHRASQLHYDFRLEWDGVLLSWAVPKGPSLDPSVKRFAQHVEDHPLDYAGFEGVIPEGQYGGGTVMVWDRGTYEPVGDLPEAFARGDLKFELSGEKLRGSWVLVRTKGLRGSGGREAWLLIKHRDEAASTDDVTLKSPCSVLTGRSLAQIARDEGGDVTKAATGDPPSARCRTRSAAKRPAAAAKK
jgi:bifunctional non-homologous end joining protein LigD